MATVKLTARLVMQRYKHLSDLELLNRLDPNVDWAKYLKPTEKKGQ